MDPVVHSAGLPGPLTIHFDQGPRYLYARLHTYRKENLNYTGWIKGTSPQDYYHYQPVQDKKVSQKYLYMHKGVANTHQTKAWTLGLMSGVCFKAKKNKNTVIGCEYLSQIL